MPSHPDTFSARSDEMSLYQRVAELEHINRELQSRLAQQEAALQHAVQERDSLLLPLQPQAALPKPAMQPEVESSETALRRLEIVLRHLPTGLLVEDEEGQIVLVNQAFCELFAIPSSPEALVGMSCAALFELAKGFFPQSDRFITRINALLAQGTPCLAEECPLADGRQWERDYVPLLIDNEQRGHLWHYRDITAHKALEHDLSTSRDSYRTVVDTIKEILFQADAAGRWTFLNRAWTEIMGFRLDESLGQSFLDFVHPDERVCMIEQFQTFLEQQKDVCQQAVRYITKEGEVRWMELYARLNRAADGTLLGTAGSLYDITERTLAEEALRKSEASYRAIVEDQTELICRFQLNGTLTFVNSAYARAFDTTPEALIGRNVLTLVPEEDHASTMSYLQSLSCERPVDTHEHRVLLPDGTVGWQQWTNRIIFDVHGTPVEIQSVGRDITDRVRMEHSLRESEARNRAFVQAIPDLMFRVNRDGIFLDYHAGDARELIIEPEIFLGKSIAEIFPPDLAQRSMDTVEQAILTGTVQVLEYQLPLGDQLSHYEARCVGIDQDEVLIITRNVTEHQQAQAALVQAKETAEQATQAKAAFLATMSHEIRTPLNAVVGMTNLLLDTTLTTEQRDYAETIRSSSDTLLTLINDILDFSKLEAGRVDVEKQPFRLRECVEEALDLVALQAAAKGLELTCRINLGTPRMVQGDVTRVRQILVNLLSNAVKFTHKGEVAVQVSTRLLAPDDYEICFMVRDTGICIPTDRFERLFKSFSQVDTSTTRKYGGTGLGLAISKGLAELMGGTLTVESTVGVGTTFFVTIRAAPVPTMQQDRLLGIIPHLANRVLLIVDDNATSRGTLVQQTQQWGIHPRAMASGAEALDWLRSGQRCDLALVDLQLPTMDGIQFALALRALTTSQKPPLVLITLPGQHLDWTFTSLFAAMLTKPIKLTRLYETITQVLNGSPFQPQHPAPVPQFNHQMGQQHPLRILLAEDNPVNQKVALRLLERLGYRADVATNGCEVLNALVRQPYDVVLMDVQMPEMDGIEATHHIRDQQNSIEQPYIIALTASAAQSERDGCLAAGMNNYLSKPIHVPTLVEVLQQCLPRQRRFRGGETSHRTVSATADSTVPVIDWHVLACYAAPFEGDEREIVVRELIESFLEDMPKLLSQLQQAVLRGATENGVQLVHRLRSSSAELGALMLAELAWMLEQEMQTGEISDIASDVVQVYAAYKEVEHALEEGLERLTDYIPPSC